MYEPIDLFDYIGSIAKSQQEFPDGIGVKRSLWIMRSVVGSKELCHCNRNELVQIINKSRREYKLMLTKKAQINEP